MKIRTGAILLIAGTCIGSGMIALPLVLAKLGIILSIALMLFIWFIMYYTSLINLELNLQAKHGLTLGALGRLFSGKGAEIVGVTSLKILSYSLLAVFIYGGSSILTELYITYSNNAHSFNVIAGSYAFVAFLLLLLPINLVDYINRILFIALMIVAFILIISLVFAINWSHLPLFSDEIFKISSWAILIPVVFTSFGFQVIFHTLTNYCGKNAKILKEAFFWGSLIPAIVYILWTFGVLSVVYDHNPAFYKEMTKGTAEVGGLIHVLSSISNWYSVQALVWAISLLAITTSVLGVGLGLCSAFEAMLTNIRNTFFKNTLAAFLTILPAYLIAILVPNAFITVLGFAGMILALIAILLPVYLFFRLKNKNLHYPELQNTSVIFLSVVVALLVIAAELFNL